MDYVFRVHCYNIVGVSDWLENLEPITAKCMYDPPGVPRSLRIMDVTADAVELKWREPVFNGGTEIIQYTIERQDKGTPKWFKVGDEAAGDARQAIINDVNEKAECRFRIYAENEAGQGDVSQPTEYVMIQDPLSPPSPPFDVQFVEIRQGYVILSWKSPATDGGSDVLGYYIERNMILADGTENWARCAATKGNETEGNVTGLRNGREYKFRVVAYNCAGMSSPSEATDEVEAKDPDAQPWHQINHEEIILVAGQKLRLQVSYGGSPQPNLEWKKDEKEFKKELGIRVQSTKAASSIFVPAVTRDHQGRYVATIENKIDTVYATCRVIVHDRPGQPQKLQIGAITKNTCELSWQEPQDNGGCKIEYYSIFKQEEGRRTWGLVNPEVTKCEWKVEDLIPETNYLFKIVAVNKVGAGEPLLSTEHIKSIDPVDKPTCPLDLSVRDVTSSSCLLKWNRPESDGGSPIIGYQIEFSEKDMDVWSVLAHNLEGTKYQCRELIEGKEYEFRIHAKNRELNSKWAYFGVIRASDPLALPVIEVIKSEDSEAEAEARAGRDLKVACNIFANPYPSVTWYHINEEGQSLQASEQRALDIFSAILGIVQPEDIPPELLTNVNAPEVTNLDEGYEGEQEGAANSIVAGRKEDSLPPQRQKGAAFTKFLEAQDAKITDPEIILTVEVKDEDAEVFWKKDKKEINLESGKYEVASKGNQRKLIVKMPRLADTGRFSCWKGTNSYTEALITFRNEDGKSQKDLDDAEEAARKAAEDASRALTVAEENEIFLERLFQESQPQFLGASDKVTVQSEAKDSKNGHFEVIVKNCTRKNRGRYLIIAENNQGRSYSIINVNVLDVPGCPQEPWSYTEPWSNAISLEWNSPEDDGGSDITGYTLQRKELERPQLGWTLIQTNISLAQFRVTNLREDRTYQFRVAAENKLGHSPWLWSRIYRPALPFDPPVKPDIPTVSHVTRVQAFVNWIEPNNGGSPIQGYYLEKKSSQGEKFIKVIRKPIDGLSYLISDNLVENMKYQFRVIAFNEAGMSPPSDPTVEVTIEDPTYPPGKPIVRVSDSTKSTIKLSWDAPEEDGNVGKENLSFIVEQLIDEENWSALTAEPIKTLDYEATDLKDQTKYSFRVKTLNKAGESPYHSITDAVARDRFEIPLIKLDEQLTQSDMVRHRANERFWIKATVTGRPFPEIVWKHNDKLIDNETNPEMEFSEDQISGQIEMYIRRPERKHWGNYKITARNCVGSKNVTTAINILDIPSPPLHVRPATVTKDFIAIAWNKPQDNGGSLVTEYIVEKRDMSMFAWLPCGKTEKLSMEINSVLETQTYMFRVAAVNAQGRSKWADSQTVTCQDPLHPPGRPEHVKVMAKLDTALTVQWVPPRNNGGSKIKGYVVDKKHFKKIEKKKKEVDEDGNEIETADEEATEAKEEVKDTKKISPQDLEKMSPADRKAWEKEQKRIAKEEAEKEAAEEEKLWEPCNQLLIPPLKIPTDPMDFRIEGLLYNERYQFRIKAVNDVGESEPAFTQQFVSKEDDCEPSITIDVGVRNVITAFRGDMISIPAHVHAVPEAHVAWTFDECEGGSHLIPVTPKELLQDTSEEKPHHELHVLNGNNYNLLIRKCERSDVGFYICRATNIHGSKYVRVQLDVNAVASPPLNFVPAEITANSCFLSWRPPEDDGSDDGGDSIMNYVVEMLEGRKREWTSCSQTVVETKFRVCQLTEGTEYTFRVAAENRFGIGEWAYTEPIIAKNPYNVPGDCQAPKIDEARKDYIIVNWQPPKENGGASIEGYWLEVQDSDNIRWRKVQRAPITKPPMARCDFRLTEVMEGIEYRFRVAAVNAAGAGPMSNPSEYAMASDPIFPPSAPGKPDTEDTSDSSISLSWSQPQKMGGTDLMGYILEVMDEITCLWQVVSYQSEEERQAKKDAAEAAKKIAEEHEAKIASEKAASEEADFAIEWAKHNKIEGELSDAQKTECAEAYKKKKAKEALGLGNEKNDKEDSLRKKASVKNYDEDDFIKHSMFTVEGLKKGFRYQFRVKAVNKAGESPFSFATAPIECRELIEAPMITLDAGLKDQFEIHSGSTIRIRANIEARPAASHKWVFEDGKDLAKEAQIESTDGTSVLVIPNANRSHSGKYTLIAKNSGGVRQCACRVLVFDTPSFPIRFEVVGVNKKSVKLQWQTPALDGGSRIDHYVVDKRREDMRAWTRCESAVGGLQYQVHDLIETEQYYFRVSAVNSVGQGQFAFTTDPVIVRDPVGISDPPYQLKINKITARTVSLSWKAPEFTGNLPITTYQIEILKNTITPEEFFAEETKSDLMKKLEKAKTPKPPPQDGDEEAPKVAPEAPGALKVMDCGTDSLTLCWLQPRKNGPITDYIVMGMKEGATQWEEFDTTGGETRYKITSIPQGKWTFGVVAINVVGKSEPATFVTSFDGENSPMIDNIDRITYEDYLATKPKTGDGSEAPPVRVGKQRRLSKRDLEVWEACNKVVITDTTYTVKSLQSGSKPSFRVIAINDYGESRSSNVVGPITCKDDIIFPGIEVLGFKEIEEGNKLEIFAKVSGNPLPEIEWLKDDKVISSDGNSKSDSNNYKIQSEIGSTCLAIDEAYRSDSGYYSIRASNVAGNGLKQIKVVILSKPGPPLGPVAFTSVSAQSQSISWLPPIDDGGCHISHYIVQRCVTDRQYWADVGEDIRSCEATSTDLHKGKYYIYRVAAVNQYGQGPFIKSEPCQAKNSCEVAERMAAPLVEGVQRDSMTVTWEAPTSDGGGNIIGYVLERRTRIQRKWTRAVHELISGTQYRVRGLNDGTEYLFRVSAVNAAGTNEPSLPSNGAIARPPIKVPSEPRNIGVKDSTETSLTLKWNAPENDGGAKVRGYFIEKHYQGTRTIPEDPEEKPEELWERVFGTEVRAHEASIKNLEKGKIIKFRVRAVNEAGEGQAGELSSYTKVEEQTEDPEIKLDSLLKDGLTIKTGKQLRLVAYVSGRPEPTCDWLFNGDAVPEHARMEESQFSRTLSIRSAEREHTGVYTITCTSGEKVISRDIKVNVLSIPSAPTGPLSVGNIIKDSVTLEWEKPSDCGGTEVTNYIVEKREASRRSWTKISMSVTRTKLVVQGLLPDEQYMFRVAAENVIGVGPFLDTKIPIVSRDPMGTPTRPEDVKYEDVMKSHVTLSWKAPSFDGGSSITHYIVEKRRVGSERYIEASDKAFLECHATLGGFSEGDNFEFRVIPFNEMGAGKPSFPTKPVICRDTIVGPKLEFDCRSKMIARVGNSLQIPALITGKPAPKVMWTHNNHELKSQERIRVKNMIGSSSILSINEAIRSDSGIYQIKLENAAGCRTGKVEVVVADKPTPVTNLDVVEVSRENVIIKWDTPEDDGGEEISNYVVEKKDLQKMMWLTVNNACLKNEIRISKLRENGEFQFRVMAENSYGLSDPQDTPTVIIRDRYKVPDASDGVRAREVFKNHVMLEWNKPYDGGKRILNYRVEKRETQSERWVRVTKELISEPKYTVKDLLEGNEYEFRVFAQNSIGYSPPSVPSKAVICSDPINPPSMPINISVVDIRKKEVTVQWGLPRHDGGAKIDGYIVETNKVGTDSWKTWCTAETQSSCQFTIPDLVESFEYYVRVKAVNKAGQSEPGMMRDKVVVVDKLAPPEIQCDGNMLHDRVVKAGNELVLSATILGTPEPSVKWIKNDPVNGDREMESKFCHKSDNGHVKLIIMDAGRVHTGRYSLIVENSIGKKQCSTYVAVLDIPSVPRDLQMSEVRADGLRLRWKQPADDGGTVISHYRVERIAKSDGSMNHWKPIALSQKKCNIDVKYLIEGECYKFRVYAENCFGIGDYAETDEIQARNPIFPPSIPQNLEIVDIQKDNVTLQWQKPGRDGGSVVTAYRVEYCSEDIDEYGESKQTAWSTFKTVSTYKCTVTGLEEGKPFKFRVRAINEAGEGRADTTIPITPIQPLVPPKIDIDIKILEGLTVRAGSTITIPAFIKGYPRPKLQWANQMGDGIDQSEDRIEIREDENSTRLTIKNACRKDSGEYSLSARNESGAKSVLIHVQVLDRPSPPVGPIEIDEMTPEYAIISWNPPKDDGGSDLTNYIIEKTII